MGNGASVASGAKATSAGAAEWSGNDAFVSIDIAVARLEEELQMYIEKGEEYQEPLVTALESSPEVVNLVYDCGNTLLHLAAEAGNVFACRAILNHADIAMINAENEDGYTPLKLAIIRSNQDVFNLFLRQSPTLAKELTKLVADEEAGSIVKTNLEVMLKGYDDAMREEFMSPGTFSVAVEAVPEAASEEVVGVEVALSLSGDNATGSV